MWGGLGSPRSRRRVLRSSSRVLVEWSCEVDWFQAAWLDAHWAAHDPDGSIRDYQSDMGVRWARHVLSLLPVMLSIQFDVRVPVKGKLFDFPSPSKVTNQR